MMSLDMMILCLKSSNNDQMSGNLHENMMFPDNMKNGNRQRSKEMKIEKIVITYTME